MKLLAKIIASVLHPATLVLPAVFLIVFQSVGSASSAFIWTFVSLVFTAIVAAFVLFGVKKGFFSDMDVSIKKQRVILYPFVVIVTLCFAGFIYFFNGPMSLTIASILFVFALVVMDVINVRIKASVHVATVASIVTGVASAYGGITVLLFLLIPLVAWARIIEKRHTLKETIVGAICGVGFTLVALNVVQLLK